jgi:HK97 gp10 family phage protein
MSQVTVDSGGADTLARTLADASEALADPGPLVADLAAQTAAMASANTPRATGALANSGRVAAGTIGGHPAQLITWGVRYAVFVNFGTRHMPARPFATDALAAVRQSAEPALRTWADKALDQIHA